MMSRQRHHLVRGLFLSGAIACATVLLAATPAKTNTSDLSASAQRTLDRFYAQNPENRTAVQKAKAVLVFPDIGNASAGGTANEGVLKVGEKTDGVYRITGASGAGQHSAILLFNAKARDRFGGKKEWTVGSDLNVVAGQEGKPPAGAGKEGVLEPVTAYVFDARGPVAHDSLHGAKITRVQW